MGTGGLGGYVGGRLARAGNDVAFIARGARLEALRRKGLEVRSVAESFRLPEVWATHDPAEIGAVDLVILSVKSYDVVSAAEAMRPLLGPETVIVPVLNGVDHMRVVREALGAEHVLGGLISMTAHVVAPGVVERLGEHGIFEFGEPTGGLSPRVEALQPVLDIDGVHGKPSASITEGMWQKFAFICGANVCCVVRGNKETVWRGMPETGGLIRQLMVEVVAVAKAFGVGLTDSAVGASMDLLSGIAPHFKPSMLVGLERGERIELEALNGAVVRYGREVGVATPANEFVYASLKPHVDGVT